MESIREELEELEIDNYEEKSFVTHDALKGLLSKEKVTLLDQELSDKEQIQVYQKQEIIDSILKNGLRTFAILLSFSRPEMIAKFIETDDSAHVQLDSKLPLSLEAMKRILKEEKVINKFDKHQWKFCVPYLHADQSHRELQDKARLPFVKCEELGEYGFGKVDKMFLPALCHDLVPQIGGEVVVVRKQLKRKGDTDLEFQRERHILSMLRCLRHPNIVKLLTAYSVKQTHNFLFPLADGDMRYFFRQENRPPGFENDNNIFQALYELASAIEAVHNYFSETFNLRKIGCHHDLKPDNILYRSGKLILSDFGLSRLTEEKDGSKSLYKNGATEYMAPECVSIPDDFRKLQVGRSSDIWSFGCILSEMLTYMVWGPCGVSKFSESRIIVFADCWTCKAFHAGDKPHEGVTRWLSNLKPKMSVEAQHRLLTMIQELLQIEPSERLEANEITLRLFYTAQHDLYGIIEESFQRLLAASELELHVEHERFRLWGEQTRVKDTFTPSQTLKFSNQWMKFTDLQTIQEGLRKLLFELERLSVNRLSDHLKMSRQYYHLGKIIDSLWDMQTPLTRASMTNELENRLLNTDEMAQLESLEASYHPDERHSETPLISANARNRGTYGRIGLLATMKQIASGLDNTRETTKDMQLADSFLKRPLKPFHWHHTGVYQPTDSTRIQVLIEYVEYDGSWSKRTDELIERVQDIATIRSIPSTQSAFPVLNCLGFYHNVAKNVFGVVYRFPPRSISSSLNIPDLEKPMSLREIISNVKSRRDRPSLDQVFKIASTLVSTVVTMHKANWVHKNISSFNVIFFPDRFDSIAASMTSPFFIGFNHSRLNLEKASTTPPSLQLEYQHPEYVKGQKRFCQEYEYYSVGLVLLELGSWVPLEEIVRKIPGSPEELKEALIEKTVPILKTYMGNSYAEAVMACLKSEFGDGLNPMEVREAFERKVLQKISSNSF